MSKRTRYEATFSYVPSSKYMVCEFAEVSDDKIPSSRKIIASAMFNNNDESAALGSSAVFDEWLKHLRSHVARLKSGIHRDENGLTPREYAIAIRGKDYDPSEIEESMKQRNSFRKRNVPSDYDPGDTAYGGDNKNNDERLCEETIDEMLGEY